MQDCKVIPFPPGGRDGTDDAAVVELDGWLTAEEDE